MNRYYEIVPMHMSYIVECVINDLIGGEVISRGGAISTQRARPTAIAVPLVSVISRLTRRVNN